LKFIHICPHTYTKKRSYQLASLLLQSIQYRSAHPQGDIWNEQGGNNNLGGISDQYNAYQTRKASVRRICSASQQQLHSPPSITPKTAAIEPVDWPQPTPQPTAKKSSRHPHLAFERHNSSSPESQIESTPGHHECNQTNSITSSDSKVFTMKSLTDTSKTNRITTLSRRPFWLFISLQYEIPIP
jgi:hypothetical protein